jgi:phosphoribosylanthranilate isomerase
MPLKTLVKVGSITNLSDARYCAGMGVDMLGFAAVEDMDNHISQDLFQQIRGWVSGPQVVAEMYGLKKTTDIHAILQNYAPDMVEVTFETYQNLKSEIQLPFIVALSANELSNMAEHHKRVAYWLVDESSVGKLKGKVGPQPILFKSTEKDKIESALQAGTVKGVAINGSPELRPGFKDYDDLSEILDFLEEE